MQFVQAVMYDVKIHLLYLANVFDNYFNFDVWRKEVLAYIY